MEIIPRERSPLTAAVVDALSVVLDLLGEGALNARTRELLAQASSYERAVKRWTTVPPSDAQMDAMLDVVTALHAKVVTGVGASRRAAAGER